MPACLIKHLRIEANMKFHYHKAHPLNPKICNYLGVPNTLDLQHGLPLQQVFNCEVFTVFSQIQHINTKLCLILFLKQVLPQQNILLWWLRKINILSQASGIFIPYFLHFGSYISSDMVFMHPGHQQRDWNRNKKVFVYSQMCVGK